MMIQQLPLAVRLLDSATFDNFFAAGNESAVNDLKSAVQPFVYLWGVAGSGKTHLLQAACHARGSGSAYLPLGAEGIVPEMLDGMEQMSLLCLDNLDAIAGDPAWETALFHLYNRLHDLQHQLVVAASMSPRALPLTLPDLQSRLGWGISYQLAELADADKLIALQMRAQRRGMHLPTEVAEYLLRRYPRDMVSLFALVERLDEGSLAAQRKITIPFVRQLLGL
ncbi:MAG: DnaA regulatory inactivator Hda [Gammaproteobacteria bacterium]